MQTYTASCHCQAVKVSVQSDAEPILAECNCSICSRLGYLHFIVPRAQFELMQGDEALVSYRFNTQIADHLFCQTCGVKVFYIPRSHPHGVSVNARCLDGDVWRSMAIRPFDGQNWEANVSQITDSDR